MFVIPPGGSLKALLVGKAADEEAVNAAPDLEASLPEIDVQVMTPYDSTGKSTPST